MSQPILTSATEAIAISVEMLNERARRIAELEAENARLQQLIRVAIIYLEDGAPYTAIDRLERALAPKETKG